jgi:hypothetical protein
MPNLTFNPYVSQYIPAPIEEFKNAAQYFQTEYDENLLATEKLKTMANSIKVLPGDKSLLAQELKTYQDQLGELAQAGNYEDASLKIRNLATDFAGNYQGGKIGQLAGSYTNYQQYQAEKQKLGNEYAVWNDDFLAYQRGGNKNQDGSYRGYTFGGLGKQENHAKRADEVLGEIAKDGSITSGFHMNEDGLTYSMGEHGSEGVGAKKLRAVAEGKAAVFSDTIEGKDYLKKMRYFAGRDLTPQEQHDLSADYLYRAGLNQLGVKSVDKNKMGFVPGWLAKQKLGEGQELEATTATLEATNNAERIEQAESAGEYEVQPDGSLMRVQQPSRAYTQPESQTLGAMGIVPLGGVPTGQGVVRTPITADDKVGQHHQQVLSQLIANQKYSGSKRPKSPEVLWKEYNEALKNTGAVFPRYAEWSPQMQKEKTKQLTGNGDPRPLLSGRKVVLVGVDGKGGKVISPNDLPEDIKDAIADGRANATIKAQTKTNPYGMPGAYVVDITKKDKLGNTAGKAYQILVQANQEEERAFGTLGQLAHAKFSGSPQTDIPISTDKNGDKRYYRVLNIPNGNKEFNQLVELRVTHANGMDAKVGQQSLDDAEDDLYRRTEKELKPYRLTSSGQTNAKGDEKDYNTDAYEPSEAE